MSEQTLWQKCERADVLGDIRKICVSIVSSDLSLFVRVAMDETSIDITIAHLKIKIYELPGGFYAQLGLDKILFDSDSNPTQLCLSLDVCSALGCSKLMDECINL
ncbi:UNVERIFIED_ORG: hypothetical protein J2W65_002454 [Pseudomonas parafulva]|nr:hypothetical protein [Pseudomonas parafulva]